MLIVVRNTGSSTWIELQTYGLQFQTVYSKTIGNYSVRISQGNHGWQTVLSNPESRSLWLPVRCTWSVLNNKETTFSISTWKNVRRCFSQSQNTFMCAYGNPHFHNFSGSDTHRSAFLLTRTYYLSRTNDVLVMNKFFTWSDWFSRLYII